MLFNIHKSCHYILVRFDFAQQGSFWLPRWEIIILHTHSVPKTDFDRYREFHSKYIQPTIGIREKHFLVVILLSDLWRKHNSLLMMKMLTSEVYPLANYNAMVWDHIKPNFKQSILHLWLLLKFFLCTLDQWRPCISFP